MPAEPIIQPGTFGSIRETTTLYPYNKFRTYVYFFGAFLFTALTIIMFMPNSILLISKVTDITPDDITAVPFRIPIAIGLLLLAVFYTYYAYLYQVMLVPTKYILSQDGIFYGSPFYRIYSSWENVIGVEDTKYSFTSLKGLKLKQEFQEGPTIEEGKQQGFPVFEYTKPIYAKKYPRKRAGRGFILFPWTNTFPLLRISTKNSIKKKFLVIIFLYAPHVLAHEIA